MITERPGGKNHSETTDHTVGRRLQLLTILWNTGEVFVTVTLGVISGSLALVAFGLDSLIEVFTSSVVLWHMDPGASHDLAERDRRARKLVALAFGILSIYLFVASTRALILGTKPEPSPVGFAYLALTALIMIILAAWKRRIGARLGNNIFLSEARMSQLDAYLAIGISSALVVNALWDWWWADPIAAGAIAVMAGAEAIDGQRDKT